MDFKKTNAMDGGDLIEKCILRMIKVKWEQLMIMQIFSKVNEKILCDAQNLPAISEAYHPI